MLSEQRREGRERRKGTELCSHRSAGHSGWALLPRDSPSCPRQGMGMKQLGHLAGEFAGADSQQQLQPVSFPVSPPSWCCVSTECKPAMAGAWSGQKQGRWRWCLKPQARVQALRRRAHLQAAVSAHWPPRSVSPAPICTCSAETSSPGAKLAREGCSQATV